MNEKINYHNLRQAITYLEKTVSTLKKVTDPDVINGLKSGIVQNFEFTYELAWKCIAKWLKQNTPNVKNDNIPKKQLFRLAADYNLLTDQQQWFSFNESRNLTSHTYDGTIIDEKIIVATNFIPVVKDLLKRLEKQ